MLIVMSLALGGVGYPSIHLALRGRVALVGGIPGNACLEDSEVSTATLEDSETATATLEDIPEECNHA